ncbi:MAG: HlyD family secretion protein [Parachlamydiaceae bacterium]
MSRHYFFWVIAITLFCVSLIFYSMWESAKPPTEESQVVMPHPLTPFKSHISGVGIVEASSDNISIGAPVNRIVKEVLVHVGEEVKKGDVLFKLEDEDLQADLVARSVDYAIAQAKFLKMKELPRAEDEAAATASFKIVQTEWEEAKIQYDMVQGLQDARALSQQEINRRRFNYAQAVARSEEALANLNKIKAGAWKPDLDIAALEIQQAKAGVQRVQADIARTIIRSPIDGKVLQIKIHEGELPIATHDLMIVGNTDEIYLKVSINQFDAPYFHSEAHAVAFLRGNAHMEFNLEFVRLVPYLVNKQNFTNEITDRTDTRVLQVIYRIENQHHPIFVGQQMDVFIEAEFPS